MRLGHVLPVLLCVSACTADGPGELAVDLRTDFQPGVEFSMVRVELAPAGSEDVERRVVDATAMFGDPFLAGRRVAEFDRVAAGSWNVRVVIADPRGTMIGERTTIVGVAAEGNVAVTVLITRDCLGVTCPGPADDPAATECQGGHCVAPDCGSECVEPECEADADCPMPAVECVVAQCISGSCVQAAMDSLCAPTEFCAIEGGCRSRCAAGTMVCGTECLDVSADPENCGACGRRCTAPGGTPVCSGGTCGVGGCMAGFADCNSTATDGCETSLATDTDCGECRRACGADASCMAGSCRCDPMFYDPGDGTCVRVGMCPSGQSRFYTDADRDGHGGGTLCDGCYASAPSGCAAAPDDCDDTSPSRWQIVSACADPDGDGYTTGGLTMVCSGAGVPPGYLGSCTSEDCSPMDCTTWRWVDLCRDLDGDSYGRMGPTTPGCVGSTLPAGYDTPPDCTDCDDTQATVSPGMTACSTSPRPGSSSFDWNCDGAERAIAPAVVRERCSSYLEFEVRSCGGGVDCGPLGRGFSQEWCYFDPGTTARCGEITYEDRAGYDECDTACNAWRRPATVCCL